ncbi:MAG: VWA domain-containing protein [Candidatus Bipolaricaulota bacterium]|nr:VWA domain-containing protein [Candidatus Bipolaricaulota bacterium]
MSLIFDAPWVLLMWVGLLGLLWWRRAQIRELARPERWATFLRLAALGVLVLGLAGPRLALSAADRYVYFLVDRSASIQTDIRQLRETLRALAPPAPHTYYALIAFGAEALVESGFAPTLPLSDFQTDPDPQATNLESAVQLALETLPRRGRREIVLLSDGQPTRGDLDRALQLARREGVPIHVWPLTASHPELWLDRFEIPEEVTPGVPFALRLLLGATQQSAATLLLYRNNELHQALSLALAPGVQEIRVTDRLDAPGVYHYRAYVKAERDRLTENNQLEAATRVLGDAPVLVVQEHQSSSPLVRILESVELKADHKTLREFLDNPLVLSHYKAVILNNISLEKLSSAQRELLKRYVRDLGGGLWLIQGRAAVEGLGGQTPDELAQLEEFLPVSYLVPEPYQIPGIALVFVLDRSGSMADPVRGGIPKLEILKRSVLRSLEILDPEDWVGIIAFSTDFQWIHPLQPLGDRQAHRENIQRLQASGGTDLYFALKDAFQTLERVSARVKHILVFTDGHNNNKREREYRELYARLAQSTVRVSALGIDREPDEEFLQGLANAGRGKYQRVQEFTDLPAFSLREVRRIARLRWIEGQSPIVSRASALEELPPLQGYVLTHEKPAAQVVLATAPEGDPILSFWSYGLGRVGVLNTDLEGDGSQEWLAWSELSRLVSESVAQIYRGRLYEEGLTLQAKSTEKYLELIVDVQDAQGGWASGWNLQATLSGPVFQEIAFTQIAPGRYRARVENLPRGVYGIHLTAQREGEKLAERAQLFTVSYAEEYRRVGANIENLDKIARLTGGQFLERPVLPPAAELSRDAYAELWPWLLALALLLFLGDLAARKLLWLVER